VGFTYLGITSFTSDATASQTTTAEKKAEAPKPIVSQNAESPKPAGPVPPAPKTEPAAQAKAKKKQEAPKATTPAASSAKPAANQATPVKPPANDAAGKQTESGAKEEQPIRSGKGITALGDSVMLDVAPDLQKLLPGIVIDAKIGRQMSQATGVIANLKAQGHLGHTIVIELGTNGSFSQKQLLKLLQSLDEADRVILVNTRVPKPWESVVNATLAQVAAAYPQTVLVDWYAASAGKDSFFYKDGVHLNPEGARFYAEFLAQAIANALADKKA
jgi:hypothetical protein